VDDVVVGVNLSPRQLGAPGLVDLVHDVLEEHDVAPRHLVLEITEEALLEDWDTAVDVVRELRAIGVGVAVDDFGTGYSSMRYLRRFATSQIKIDREFVEAVAHEKRTRILVASVVDLAADLGLTTVAEGIETLDQLHIMRSLGCRLAQGYLFDRPMERNAFAALLRDGHTYPVARTSSRCPGRPLPASVGLRQPKTELRHEVQDHLPADGRDPRRARVGEQGAETVLARHPVAAVRLDRRVDAADRGLGR
jgi:predicted signal transduction protein with EAL and GGDEF domain